MMISQMRERANNLFGIIKNAGTVYQKITKKFSFKASRVEFTNSTFYERREVHKSHMLQVELRRVQTIAEVQRPSPR
jgi:hypothetical protein